MDMDEVLTAVVLGWIGSAAMLIVYHAWRRLRRWRWRNR